VALKREGSGLVECDQKEARNYSRLGCRTFIVYMKCIAGMGNSYAVGGAQGYWWRHSCLPVTMAVVVGLCTTTHQAAIEFVRTQPKFETAIQKYRVGSLAGHLELCRM
jgi:hypothetical protein